MRSSHYHKGSEHPQRSTSHTSHSTPSALLPSPALPPTSKKFEAIRHEFQLPTFLLATSFSCFLQTQRVKGPFSQSKLVTCSSFHPALSSRLCSTLNPPPPPTTTPQSQPLLPHCPLPHIKMHTPPPSQEKENALSNSATPSTTSLSSFLLNFSKEWLATTHFHSFPTYVSIHRNKASASYPSTIAL